MIQTRISEIAETLFPFSDIQNLSITIKEESFGKTNDDRMELPVNNYLKTPREIELEFQYGINPRKIGLHEKRNGMNPESSIINTDGYLNIHNLDETLSGFMEENY
jgi:hypothetical protein